MNIGTKIVLALLVISLYSCKRHLQKTKPKPITTEFDFSSIDKFKETKEKGLIISDYSSVFEPTQRQELSNLITDYNLKTTRQIAVVTVDRISPYNDIGKFTNDLANYLGVGEAKKDNGLVMALCTSCKQIFIATGTGTELILTDDICKEVIQKTMVPEFKKGDFYNGIKNGVTVLIEKWK